ncbi:MAG: cation-translocating P-type ATPase [Clostridia bacterium]|nr:cation-translocating P-type ATPase [Clostridia bacterium]
MNNWHVLDYEKVAKTLNTSIKSGLNHDEVSKRLKRYGYNVLERAKKKNIILRFINQFKDFMVLILLASSLISFFLGEITDGAIIFFIIFTNALIGLIQEGKAEKSIESLQKMSKPKCKVIRDSKIEVIASENLVIGDIVILETGDQVPADIRLIESINLTVQEASFTGETIPVIKQSESMTKVEVGLGDRKNMAFSSSLVTYGRGTGIVIATGMNTEIGKIANFIQTEVIQDTPLKKKLESLGKILGIIALSICLVIFLMGIIIYKMDIFEIFLVAISLAVAAIPEGLPAATTIVLAIGVQKMAKKKAIIRKLPSVETLGNTTVICSDKTGTLTQNKMTVKQIYIDNDIVDFSKNIKITENVKQMVNISILCNDSKMSKNSIIGDPTETALVDMGIILKMHKVDIDKSCPRIGEFPFDSNRKCMSTIHNISSKYFVYTKGGLDEVLAKCSNVNIGGNICRLDTSLKSKITKANVTMTSNALRVLAIAYKQIDKTNVNISEAESDLIFVGLVGMLDPPRPEVKEAIKKCTLAGIKTIMITGDHKITAVTIAKELGIVKNDTGVITGEEMDKMPEEEFVKKVKEYSVYARVSPEHKIKIVKALKANNEIVAMTGDGINDAPALKAADIGISMGVIGTDVAKEASDMILANDNFATIVSAVEEGRRILDNITKSIKFLLSCNTGEIFTIFFAMLFGMAKPFLPIHILLINLVTDSLPALALGVDPPDENIMKRKPNKSNKSILTPKVLLHILYQGITISIATLIAFCIGLQIDIPTAQTMAFLVLGFSQLAHSFNIHINHKSIFSFKTFSNVYLIFATILSGLIMILAVNIPILRQIFEFAILSNQNILYVVILSLAPVAVMEVLKRFKIE